MKTKTLLIAAAALAAGVMSSQAQVYSQNIVGYVNLPLTNGVLAAVAPTLDFDGTGTNNTVSSVFTAPALNDTVFVFNGSGYDALTYKAQGSGHPVVYVTNWFEGVTISSNYPINPGVGIFYLPAATETATIVGNVLSGTNIVNQYFPTANSIALISSKVPIAGGLTSVLGYNPSLGDNVFIYDNGSYNAYTYKAQGSGHPVVYVTNWFNGVTAGEPQIGVGEGFWLQPSSNTNWVQTFNP